MTIITMSHTRRRWILAGLMATMMLAAMDVTIVATAVPQIVGDLGGFSLFTWVFSIYLLTQTVTIPVYGKLADLYGRKPVLIGGAIMFLIGSAACASAWSMISLIAFRGLQGLGAGSIMATVNTLAADLYSLRERARIQGWLASVWGISAIVGPTLGGTFAEYLSWHWIFLVNLPVGAVAIGIIGLLFHEQVERREHRIDVAGAVLVLACVGLLIFDLLQGGQAWPWLSTPSLVILAVAVVLIAVTVVVERRAAEPIIPGWLWRHRALACSNLAMVGLGAALMGPNAYLPTYGQAVLGLAAVAAGLMLASMSIGWPTASAYSGRLYLRIGFRNTGLIGAVLLVLGAGLFLALPQPLSVWVVVVDQVIIGAGFGLISTPLLVGVQNSVDWGDRGVVTGGNIFARYLGQSIGAALFGAIFNAAIADRLARAPADVAGQLPAGVNGVVEALQDKTTGGATTAYLQEAVAVATRHVYAGILVIALLTLVATVAMPRVMPSLRRAQSVNPTGQDQPEPGQ